MLFKPSNTACALTFFVRIQTLFEGPGILRLCQTAYYRNLWFYHFWKNSLVWRKNSYK